jgi:hypothetical protein
MGVLEVAVLIGLALAATGCSTQGSAEVVLVRTDSYEVVAGGLVVEGCVIRFSGSLLRVRTKPPPSGPPPAITQAEILIYVDRNRNGTCDPGEVLNHVASLQAGGTSMIELAVGDVRFPVRAGPVRFRTEIRFTDGSRDVASGNLTDN